MAKRLSEAQKIVKPYLTRSPKNFKLHIETLHESKLNSLFDALEEECEYDFIQICLDEFRRRQSA